MKNRSIAKPSRSGRTREVTTAQGPVSFCIVGIGASAGGLEAFIQLLQHLPPDMGMGFVIISHLAPSHQSALTELLARPSKLPVHEVRDGMPVERNHVYVIPPNVDMTMAHGNLKLMPRTEESGSHMPVDYFLRSLAEEAGDRAIGVVLSGNGSDGTLGLRAVKAAGGITFAQDPKSAKFDGMPGSAIASGCVDFVQSPKQIAEELGRIAHHPHLASAEPTLLKKKSPSQDGLFGELFTALRSNSGVDFSHYKANTLHRRISRRMTLVRQFSLNNYVQYLKNNRGEVEALFDDLLIHVTGFFRDPSVFHTLQKKIFPQLTKGRPADVPLRVWTPGCSTGEEAYSLAIALTEFLETHGARCQVQIFATDISERNLSQARSGMFPESISADVSAERLRAFFRKRDSGYQVNKAIRDMCIFARQNVITDPPFSALDLISCRNVLIYMDRTLQNKIMPVFHYALKPTGLLLLGSSESVGQFSDLFAVVDAKSKIYRKKESRRRLTATFEKRDGKTQSAQPLVTAPVESKSAPYDVARQADHILLSHYAPSGVVVNDRFEVVHFRGRTGHFLEHSAGEADLNLLRMAREGMAVDLRVAISQCKKSGLRVRKSRLRARTNGSVQEIDIEVVPIHGAFGDDRFFLVLFTESSSAPARHAGKAKKITVRPGKHERDMAGLHEELETTKATLQITIDEQQATNEELRSANEEILSANEELQSTNEELETAKEEVQSTNEELTTLNDELQTRNSDLDAVNNDLTNLLSSINIPLVILNRQLQIRRFTPAAEKVLNVIPGDVGRPITDLKLKVEVPDLAQTVREVIETLTPRSMDVRDTEGHVYSLRIRPYKTLDSKIEGAILALIDVHATRTMTEAMLETMRECLLVLDQDLRIQKANGSFYRTFKVEPIDTEDVLLYELGNGQWQIPELRRLLGEIVERNAVINNFRVEHNFPGVGHKVMRLNARRIDHKESGTRMILLAMEDENRGGGDEIKNDSSSAQ